ncbi:MAG: hypothetical protein MUC60_01570 [Oscillatoria sp. Prado101]|nr:hypothetical protein [Oscillatoria sp. Prado101]
MKPLIQFSLDGEDSILVEVEELPEDDDSGLVAISGNQVIKTAQQSFDAALEKIKPMAASIISKVRSLSDPPDEVEVKFGVKMSSEAGAVIAKASLEGNYEITLKWKREKQ